MGHGEHHITPAKTYLNILLMLLVLTVVTVGAARIDFGFMNTVIAMAIASVKAGFVLAYFMHLKYDDKLYLTVFLLGIFFVCILFLFSIVDISTRVIPPALVH